MQLSYGRYHSELMLGMPVSGAFRFTDPMIAAEALPFGRGVIRVPNTKDQVRLTRPNYATLTVSADLIASNSTIVTVDGTATTATVYATSHAATMAAIVTKVAALATVAKAWLDTSNNRIIHIIGVGATITAAGETTLGATQPTWAAIASVYAANFFGIVQGTQAMEGALPNADNEGSYAAKSLVNVLRKGRIAVNFETAFDPDKDTLYVRYTADTGLYIGDFRNDADTSKATSLAGLPIRVISHLTAAGLGIIEIDLP